eukprot:scaffold155072_cov18-Tisochrysis_lutea.AAC.1
MATLACWTQADSPRGPDAQPTLRPPEGNQALCNPGWSLLFKHPYLLVVPGELTSGSPNLLPMAFVWMEIQNSYTHVYDINLRVHMHHVLARRLDGHSFGKLTGKRFTPAPPDSGRPYHFFSDV